MDATTIPTPDIAPITSPDVAASSAADIALQTSELARQTIGISIAVLLFIVLYAALLITILYLSGKHTDTTIDHDAQKHNKMLFWIIVALVLDKLLLCAGIITVLLITIIQTSAAL